MKDEIMKSFIELAFTVMSAVITIVLLPAVAAWLKSKTENEQIKSIITDISSAVATCVDHSEQTLVATLKSEDKWDKAAQNEVLNAVKKNVIDSLLETTKATVAENGIDIEQLVTQHIEAYIQSKKGVVKNETLTLEEVSH
jgi:hypothetical protein